MIYHGFFLHTNNENQTIQISDFSHEKILHKKYGFLMIEFHTFFISMIILDTTNKLDKFIKLKDKYNLY